MRKRSFPRLNNSMISSGESLSRSFLLKDAAKEYVGETALMSLAAPNPVAVDFNEGRRLLADDEQVPPLHIGFLA